MEIIFKRPDDTEYGPICGVVATAIVTGKTFKETHEYYRAVRGSRWKGDLRTSEILSGIKHYGGKVTQLDISGYKKGVSLANMTMMLSLRFPKDVFIVFTRKHVQVIHNLHAADQNEVKKVANFWAKRRIVSAVYRVEGVTVSSIETVTTKAGTPVSRRVKAKKIIDDNPTLSNPELIKRLVEELGYGVNTATVYVSQLKNT